MLVAIRVVGLQASQMAGKKLISALKFGAAQVNELELTPDLVSPSIDCTTERGKPGEHITIYVEGISGQDDQTSAGRKKLAAKIFKLFQYFVHREILMTPKFAKVIVYGTISSEDVCHSGDVQNGLG